MLQQDIRLPLCGLPAPRAPRGLPRRSEEPYCFVKTGLGPGLISGSLYNFSAQSSALPGCEDARLRAVA